MAGLNYSGTHVMRHGGCSSLYNKTGDLSLAQMHLGNKDVKSVVRYAHRSPQALNNVVSKLWPVD
jgi:site-specific recombinase XerD